MIPVVSSLNSINSRVNSTNCVKKSDLNNTKEITFTGKWRLSKEKTCTVNRMSISVRDWLLRGLRGLKSKLPKNNPRGLFGKPGLAGLPI